MIVINGKKNESKMAQNIFTVLHVNLLICYLIGNLTNVGSRDNINIGSTLVCIHS